MKESLRKDPVRPAVFTAAALILFLLLSLRLFHLQIVHGSEYRVKSEDNRIRLVEVVAPRGVIRDREGNLVVSNVPAYSCYGVPHELWQEPSSMDSLSGILKLDIEDLRSNLIKPVRWSFRPIRIQRDLDFDVLSAYEEQRDKIPGTFLEIEPKRYHPGGHAAHLLGYVGEVTQKDVERNPHLEISDLVGKTGLEKLYDSYLRGVNGRRFSVVNAYGQEMPTETRLQGEDPQPGKELWLTLDLQLQAAAESLLTGYIGSIVALEVETGGILAMASSPTYDPDIFSGSIDQDGYQRLVESPELPMLNRSVQTMYPPGSTAKMALLIQGLELGIITSDWSIYCPGYHRVGDRTFKCWRSGGHGRVGCITAIEASCDVFFYRLGLKLGVDGIHDAYRRFQFGELTGVDQTSEAPGLVPSTEYYDRRYGPRGWTKGYIPSISIGQGEVLVTPLQLCAYIAALADGSYWRTPYLLEAVYDPVQDSFDRPKRPSPIPIDADPEIMGIVQEGLRRVVWGTRGTARMQRDDEVMIAGKTGTAQNPHGEDHAWFIGYAPLSQPLVAAAVLIEFGEHGSSAAAPLAREILKNYVTRHQKQGPMLAAVGAVSQ